MTIHTPQSPDKGHNAWPARSACRMSLMEQLAAVVAYAPLWDLTEEIEALPSGPNSSASGASRRKYRLMDIIVMEAASQLYAGITYASRHLRDRRTWRRLRRAAQRAFPTNSTRRLSPTAPSRHQHYRARRDHLHGETLATLRHGLRTQAVKLAKDQGGFAPTTGSWAALDESQCVVAESTQVPGREVVMLSCRGSNGNERIMLDAEFVGGGVNGTSRNDADRAASMLRRLLDEHSNTLQPGLRGFVYDMAMTSKTIDHFLDMGVLPITKVPISPAESTKASTSAPGRSPAPNRSLANAIAMVEAEP